MKRALLILILVACDKKESTVSISPPAQKLASRRTVTHTWPLLGLV